MDYLVDNCIPRSRLKSKGLDETEPVVLKLPSGEEVELIPDYIYSIDDEDKQEEYHQRNRRTAFKVLAD